MIIDLGLLILMLMALYKGYSRGLVIALFSFLALLVGLAAAIKLSAVAATYLKGSLHVGTRWLPLLAFLLVFIAAVLLVRMGAAFLDRSVKWAMLGWLNRLGGILLYACLYLMVYSVLLFYATRMSWLDPKTMAASRTYAFIEPWGPRVMGGIGSVLPFFANMFHDLEDFFSRLSDKISYR
jgi:membrane protein required for colicin V production